MEIDRQENGALIIRAHKGVPFYEAKWRDSTKKQRKRRLGKAGIGEFCLELHSDKASPKAVLESIEERLKVQPIAVPAAMAGGCSATAAPAVLAGTARRARRPLTGGMPVPAESVVRRGSGVLAGSAGKAAPAAVRAPLRPAPLAAAVMAAAGERVDCYTATPAPAGLVASAEAEPVAFTAVAVAPAEPGAPPGLSGQAGRAEPGAPADGGTTSRAMAAPAVTAGPLDGYRATAGPAG